MFGSWMLRHRGAHDTGGGRAPADRGVIPVQSQLGERPLGSARLRPTADSPSRLPAARIRHNQLDAASAVPDLIAHSNPQYPSRTHPASATTWRGHMALAGFAQRL